MAVPDFLNLKRLEGRIVGLFLALLLVVQLASFALINRSIAMNADGAIAQELAAGERILLRLLAQDARQREDAASLLEKDHGFRSVLAEGIGAQEMRATLRDALVNHGKRIKADLVAYVDADYRLVTATTEHAAPFVALLPQLKARATLGSRPPSTPGGARPGQAADPATAGPVPGPLRSQANLAIVEDRPYQVVAVPVSAAGLGGWVLMAFALDDAPLRELQGLSKLQAVLLIRGPENAWRPVASVFDGAATASIARQVPSGPRSFALTLADEHLRGLYVDLVNAPGRHLGVALTRSFDDAVAPYRRLQLTLLGLTVLGVVVFAFGSVFTARRITGPVRVLSESARRFALGDYETPVAQTSSDEIGELAHTFEAMRIGIREREEQVHRLAFWDPLTGLPNREQFSQKLHDRLQSSEEPCAIVMLDLDRFKHVNDVLGHRFGDRLLCSVAKRLQQVCKGRAQLLARLGGDEFAFRLEGADEVAAVSMARRIQRDFEVPIQIDDQTVDLGAGIGIALFPAHGREMNVLLSRAELAMYAAKRQQSGSQVYEPRLDAGSQESLSLLSELRQALGGGELRLFLQPKIELKSGRVIGAEALLRWQHPVRGLMSPMQFIPFAEQTGFVRQLTTWVIAESAQIWTRTCTRASGLRISVNLSTRDLMDQELPAKIMAVLEQHGAGPEAFSLEITESAIMDDPQRALQTLEQLSRLGFRLSIDDFGTGYSSLAYLKRLPVDELKIDRSFVMAMERDLDDARIVRSTIELAHNLGLSVVAEGLETLRTWKLLAALGCDEGQGFFIARPMPETQFVEWLEAWQAPDLVRGSTPDSVLANLA